MKKVILTKLENQDLLDFLNTNSLIKYLNCNFEVTIDNVNSVSLEPLSKNLLPLLLIKDAGLQDMDVNQFDIICQTHTPICQEDIAHKEYRIIV